MVENKTLTEPLDNGFSIPVIRLGFSNTSEEGSYLDYKIENQVYNFDAEVHVDAYKVTYGSNNYDVPEFKTTINFDFMFVPREDGKYFYGDLKLIGNNPDYKVGQGGRLNADNETSSRPKSIITTAAKGLGNSFYASKSKPASQMQFQAGLVAHDSWGLRLVVWPYTDENSKIDYWEGCYITIPQPEKPSGGMPQMSATYSITPKK